MTKNIRKRFLLKKAVLRKVLLVLALVSLYCLLQGKFVWSGTLFLVIGILTPFSGLPYAALFFLIGLTSILIAYKKIILLLIVALFITSIAILDAIPLIRSVISRKPFATDKSDIESFLRILKENEITYKLWNKLKHKYEKKPEKYFKKQ